MDSWSEATLTDIYQGNRDAVRLVMDVSFVSHIYDDLIDRDKAVSPADIHALMLKLMFTIPENPVYQTCAIELRALMYSGLLAWHAANDIEREGGLENLRIAHVLRFLPGQVAIKLLQVVGGHQYAVANAKRVWLLLIPETYHQYIMSFPTCG